MRKTIICLVALLLFGTAALFAGSAPVETTDCNVTAVGRYDTFTCVSGTTEWTFHVNSRTRYSEPSARRPESVALTTFGCTMRADTSASRSKR